jgi:hypothetical protein
MFEDFFTNVSQWFSSFNVFDRDEAAVVSEWLKAKGWERSKVYEINPLFNKPTFYLKGKTYTPDAAVLTQMKQDIAAIKQASNAG